MFYMYVAFIAILLVLIGFAAAYGDVSTAIFGGIMTVAATATATILAQDKWG